MLDNTLHAHSIPFPSSHPGHVEAMNRLTFVALLVLGVTFLTGCAVNQSIRMSRDDFGLNFVPVRINGHQGLFLVDSGASHTVIDHRFAKRCIRRMTESDMRLAWLGSEDTQAKEGIVEEIQVGNYRRIGPFKAHILNLDAINQAPARQRTIRMDGIIGADFFITHRAMIDYQSNALFFNPGAEGWMERLAPPPRAYPAPRR